MTQPKDAKQAPQKPRRRYTRPEIVSSEAFERLALSCSGTSGGSQKQTGRGAPPCSAAFS